MMTSYVNLTMMINKMPMFVKPPFKSSEESKGRRSRALSGHFFVYSVDVFLIHVLTIQLHDERRRRSSSCEG